MWVMYLLVQWCFLGMGFDGHIPWAPKDLLEACGLGEGSISGGLCGGAPMGSNSGAAAVAADQVPERLGGAPDMVRQRPPATRALLIISISISIRVSVS